MGVLVVGTSLVAPLQSLISVPELLKDFMSKWGPDVQRRRDERDEKWDEMIRVLSIQKRDE